MQFPRYGREQHNKPKLDTRFGGHSEGETPGPIPNPEVKPFSADGTAPETRWESRTPPNTLQEGPPPTPTRGRPFILTTPTHISPTPTEWVKATARVGICIGSRTEESPWAMPVVGGHLGKPADPHLRGALDPPKGTEAGAEGRVGSVSRPPRFLLGTRIC